MKKIVFFIVFLTTSVCFSQIKGKITDENNAPMPYVSIYTEDGTVGTTSNENGDYQLNIKEKKPTLIFQFLGYKLERKTLDIQQFPYELNITLQEESFQLNEVIVSNKDNPANAIIRNAIKNRVKNSEKANRFEADFYSKGFFRVRNVPKKILGQEVGDADGSLDSTGTGIVYQSETISKVKFQKPNKLKEHIIASKIAGNSNGFSFNTAADADFDFYDEFLNFDAHVVSPLADAAFSYYKFQLESTFYDDKNRIINKIKMIPKRDKEPVFEGYIYIVEDSWAIYALDVLLKGYRMQNPAIKELHIVQNFSYNQQENFWSKNLQTIDLKAKILVIELEGTFSYVYSNYKFRDAFDKKEFKGEIRSFAENSNKKDSLFWEKHRQIPLTAEETLNYIKKDSVERVRSSEKYIDSVETKQNKFGVWDVLTGYTYRKKSKGIQFSYKGLVDPMAGGFNTVQGWFLGSGFSFVKWSDKTFASTNIYADFQYSFAENRLRFSGGFARRFNRINNAKMKISGGVEARQFNRDAPISGLVNAVSSLFFKDNYMKLYNDEFLQVAYSQDVSSNIVLSGGISFSQRKPLINNTDYAFVKKEKSYTSNNPLQPDIDTEGFEKHYVTKFALQADFYFNRTYTTLPNRRVYDFENRYPSLHLTVANAFSTSKKSYQHQLVSGQVRYAPSFSNKGKMDIDVRGGWFFNAKDISFIDYKHFNGNQTHVQLNENLASSFYLLPYYSHSTNEGYLETHVRHRFGGFLSNKIALFNKLQWNFVAGFHQINRPKFKPYQELTFGLENIGWGIVRFLRVEYVRTYEGGFKGDGIMFGLTF
ncbi:DUF5686 and carboxypeptidase regulatory-like domain-containing protein [Capnocytophaga sp.]|uniref:DUF5686 and carboxypeptidase regulatory-like domain-containing protein n=1 Tax=Capnocytophaga sp. TaxID=44737 RepID=UPI0026DD6924|nr:DUF5686 and carboxypeptidase regulatory-like domain-containing protein [Capnocytophaga sp.]MDO5104449.1 DUF5686 and carboxypeptidase regulatory-like domain-containing protein [Capnocytophaga sp.]